MIQYATLEDAKRAVLPWGGDPASLSSLGNRGNSVFSFRNSSGALQILRLTDPAFRTFEELEAELEFVDQLYEHGAGVAPLARSTKGDLAIALPCEATTLLCSSIHFAPGEEVQEGSPHWNSAFFREWGANLARIHEGSVAVTANFGAGARWQWDKELLIQRADELFPAEDHESRAEFSDVLEQCRALPRSPSTFGLIHADHAPQNFRFEPQRLRITAFDFGNCCHHWFVADLAISLSTIRRKTNRHEIRASLLSGYSAIRDLPENLDDLLELFIRLRVLYVYLSRLHLWSERKTAQQERELAKCKALVNARTGWAGAEKL